MDRFPTQTENGSSESGETNSDGASYLATVTSNLLPVTLGCDPTGPLQQETVTAVQVHTVYSLRDVTLKNADGTTETIDTTDSHPFYVQGQGWVSADDLMAGETLSTPDGQTETVVGTSSVAEPQGVLVYNFTVADDHTYFVEGFGNNGTTGSTPGSLLDAVWVHNSCFRQRLLAFLGQNDPGAVFQAHHIVSLNEPGAAAQRLFLENLGIKLNDPVNGVMLPFDINAELHQFDFEDYVDILSGRLDSALRRGGVSGVRSELQQVATDLLTGNFFPDW